MFSRARGRAASVQKPVFVHARPGRSVPFERATQHAHRLRSCRGAAGGRHSVCQRHYRAWSVRTSLAPRRRLPVAPLLPQYRYARRSVDLTTATLLHPVGDSWLWQQFLFRDAAWLSYLRQSLPVCALPSYSEVASCDDPQLARFHATGGTTDLGPFPNSRRGSLSLTKLGEKNTRPPSVLRIMRRGNARGGVLSGPDGLAPMRGTGHSAAPRPTALYCNLALPT
jgi:hypothetical protein